MISIKTNVDRHNRNTKRLSIPMKYYENASEKIARYPYKLSLIVQNACDIENVPSESNRVYINNYYYVKTHNDLAESIP